MSHNNNRLIFYKRTAPTFRAVTLSELKAHIGLAQKCSGAMDTKLELLIDSATECFEKMARTVVLESIFEVKFDSFVDDLELRRYPLKSITTVKYFDDETPSVEQTVDSSNYYIIEDPFYSQLAYIDDFTFPSIRDREQSVIITFVAGWTDKASNTPADIKLAILEQASFFYQNSGCDPEKSITPVTKSIANKYKPIELGGRCHV